MDKKDVMIVVLAGICVFMVVFNVFMAIAVKRKVDICNYHWKQQMIDHHCITEVLAEVLPTYDLNLSTIVPNNDTGWSGYEWH